MVFQQLSQNKQHFLFADIHTSFLPCFQFCTVLSGKQQLCYLEQCDGYTFITGSISPWGPPVSGCNGPSCTWWSAQNKHSAEICGLLCQHHTKPKETKISHLALIASIQTRYLLDNKHSQESSLALTTTRHLQKKHGKCI